MKFTFKRSRIGGGEYYNDSTQEYCVIGEYLRQLGVDAATASDREIRRKMQELAPWLRSPDSLTYSVAWHHIAFANDSMPRDEKAIVSEFAKHGVEVEFVN